MSTPLETTPEQLKAGVAGWTSDDIADYGEALTGWSEQAVNPAEVAHYSLLAQTCQQIVSER